MEENLHRDKRPIRRLRRHHKQNYEDWRKVRAYPVRDIYQFDVDHGPTYDADQVSDTGLRNSPLVP